MNPFHTAAHNNILITPPHKICYCQASTTVEKNEIKSEIEGKIKNERERERGRGREREREREGREKERE